MIWIDGDPVALPIEWQTVSQVVTTNPERELLTVRLTARATNYTGGMYWDDFVLKRNLTDERATGNMMTFLPIPATGAGADLELPAIGASRDIEIKSAHLVPSAAMVGDNTDYIVLKVRNKASGNNICTLTFTLGTDADAYEVIDFGGADADETILETGDAASIVVTNVSSGMALPASLLVIEYNLA